MFLSVFDLLEDNKKLRREVVHKEFLKKENNERKKKENEQTEKRIAFAQLRNREKRHKYKLNPNRHRLQN